MSIVNSRMEDRRRQRGGRRSHPYQPDYNSEVSIEVISEIQSNLLNYLVPKGNDVSITKKQFKIPREEVSRFKSKYGISAVVTALSKLISERNLEFPYKRYFIQDIQGKFENLVKYKYVVLESEEEYTIPTLCLRTDILKPFTYKNKFVTLPSKKEDYDEINIIGDYFYESSRIHSRAGANTSRTIDHWLGPRLNSIWLHSLLRRNNIPIDSYQLREGMYRSVKSGEPSSFKATVAATVVRKFGARRVLDYCAGWGDRLLGAVSCHENLDLYYGVDPNSDLHPSYERIKSTFLPTDSIKKFVTVCEPFEEHSLPEGTSFDLIFTGPPYYNYEIYGSDHNKKQSVTKFPDLSEWTVKFLFFTAWKAWQFLDIDGTMAINISDVGQLSQKNIIFAEALNLFIQATLPGACYQGVICFTGANMPLPRPIWIYTKSSSPSTSSHALGALRSHYPSYYSLLEKVKTTWKKN